MTRAPAIATQPARTPPPRAGVGTAFDPILDERPPYLVAGLLSLVVLVIYGVTLAPTTQFWDTSEYLAAAKVLGIPHPPGNPLFVLLAHVWGELPLAASYAKRINLFAAVTSALSAGLWFLIAERWLRHAITERWPRRAAAIAGAVVGATAFTVWNQSVVNEKVYTLSLFSIALILWLAVRWADQPAGLKRDQRLITILYLLAFTATNHLMGLLVGPAVILLAFATLRQDPRTHAGAPFGEWAKFGVFCAAWALLIFIGLENPKYLIMG
ncbi:MAG: glycosyltransferase family 117 protein, partial [Gemmatimonadales bacterium]